MAQPTTLGKLFGSEGRVRLMRLFLMSPNEIFDAAAVARRIQMQKQGLLRDLKILLDVGYIKRGTRVVTLGEVKSGKLKRKKIAGFTLARDFVYLNEIAQLLASDAPRAREKLAGGLKSAGKVALIVIAGRLLSDDTRTVDVFIVGDLLKKNKIERALKTMESATGKELVYAVMATKEFQYRYGLYDRFLKELFDNPHEIIFNKLGIG